MLDNPQTGVNYNDVSNIITDKILRGELKRGDKLPTERDLAKELNVSRPVVREAFKALQLLGIFESRQGSGTYVTDKPEDTINNPLAIVYALSDSDFVDLQQFRICLETEACRGIIEKASDEEIESLLPFLDPEKYREDDLVTQRENDAAFHAGIICLSGNIIIKYLYNTLWMIIGEQMRSVLSATAEQGEMHTVLESHVEICDALRQRDFQKASAAVTRHLHLDDRYQHLLRDAKFRSGINFSKT